MIEAARPRGMDSLVVTFEPLPAEVLHPDGAPSRLTDIEERIDLLAELEVDRTAVLRFSHEMSRLEAGDFLSALRRRYAIREMWAGEDFAFGHNREGDIAFLRRAGREGGFGVHVIDRLGAVSGGGQALDGPRLSSSSIRRLLVEGDIRGAATLLGHHPTVSGRVVRGAGRGRQLGFPTANVGHPAGKLIPKVGIYAGFARLQERRLQAAVSIGHDPTFGDNPLTVEAYILDFDEDIYDQRISVEIVERLRDEQAFASVDELVRQIERDVVNTREVLKGYDKPAEDHIGRIADGVR
jgi:riboflavin kinase/FMN adenylyltransferase